MRYKIKNLEQQLDHKSYLIKEGEKVQQLLLAKLSHLESRVDELNLGNRRLGAQQMDHQRLSMHPGESQQRLLTVGDLEQPLHKTHGGPLRREDRVLPGHTLNSFSHQLLQTEPSLHGEQASALLAA